MQFLAYALLEEFLDGAAIRAIFTKPFGPYSSSWYRKNFHSNVGSIDVRKIKKKVFENYYLKCPPGTNQISAYDLDSAPEQAVPPDMNVEYIESLVKGVAPVAAYLSRDIDIPFEIGIFESSERHSSKVIDFFPYCHYWEVDESLVKDGKYRIESAIDCCLMLFTCFYIDAEMTMDLSEVVHKILLEGVHRNYHKNYGVSCYVNYKLDRVKQSPDESLEGLYDHWANWDDSTDRDSIEKLLKRWRKGSVTPSSKLFGDFVYMFGGRTPRSFVSELTLVGFFLIIQLIQKYRLQEEGYSKLLSFDSFYQERVHFWHDKLSEQYKDVIARRAAEKAQEESGPD
jgi:hypothetical protein